MLCGVWCVGAVYGVVLWHNTVVRKGFHHAHGRKIPHCFDCSSNEDFEAEGNDPSLEKKLFLVGLRTLFKVKTFRLIISGCMYVCMYVYMHAYMYVYMYAVSYTHLTLPTICSV